MKISLWKMQVRTGTRRCSRACETTATHVVITWQRASLIISCMTLAQTSGLAREGARRQIGLTHATCTDQWSSATTD